MSIIQYKGKDYYKSKTEAEYRVHVSGTGNEVIVIDQAQLAKELERIGETFKLMAYGGYLGRLIPVRLYRKERVWWKEIRHKLDYAIHEEATGLEKERLSQSILSSIWGNKLKLTEDKTEQLRGIDGYFKGHSIQIKYDRKMSESGNIFYELGTRPCELEAEIQYREMRGKGGDKL